MGINLNCRHHYYHETIKNDLYIDKSLIIDKLNGLINKNDRFLCISRPRRFTKSNILIMLDAYYSKGSNTNQTFEQLKISSSPSFEKHLNKHNVFFMDLFYYEKKRKFNKNISNAIISKLAENFPNVKINKDKKIYAIP